MENTEVKKIDVSLQSTMVLLGAISSELKTKSYTDYQTIAPAAMREVCNRLHLTRRQVLLVVALFGTVSADVSEIAFKLNCEGWNVLQHYNQLVCLEKLDVVDSTEYESLTSNNYSLKDDFVEMLLKSGVREYVDPAKRQGYLHYLDIVMLYLRLEDEGINRKDFVDLVVKISRNRNTVMDKLHLSNQELVFAVVAQALMNCSDSERLWYNELSALYTPQEYDTWLKRVQRSKKLKPFFSVSDSALLMRKSVFVIETENLLSDDKSFLTIDFGDGVPSNPPASIGESLGKNNESDDEVDNDDSDDMDDDNDDDPFGLDLFRERRKTGKLLTKIDHSKIEAVNMFYTASDAKEIANLTDMLREERYVTVLERLAGAGMRRGITIVLHGLPGTGKTETVRQLGRLTGRDILHVDISSIRGMYVGDNERNIKSLFEEYSFALKKSKLHPILFFNEADSLLGARCNDNNMHSADRGENSMQNILLEQLESFEGILIATTNMATNFDKAFERRFLFKMGISKPTPEVRAKIWTGKIAGLDNDTALRLAEKYDFSGGQIENIARKVIIDQVLTGSDEIDPNKLFALCESEQFAKIIDRKPIGFASKLPAW